MAAALCAVVLGVVVGAPASASGAAAWLAPHQLEPPLLAASEPAIAADAAGDVVAVWAEPEGVGQMVVLAAERVAGGTFGAPTVVAGPGAGVGEPAVALDAHGDALVSWSRGGAIEAALRPAGGAFAAPEDLSVESEEGSSPVAAFDSAGDAVVAWEAASNRGLPVFHTVEANVRPVGSGFGVPHELDSLEQTASESIRFAPLRITADGTGDLYLAWAESYEQRGGPGEERFSSAVKVAKRPPKGPFSIEPPLAVDKGEGAVTESVSAPALAADARGDAVVAWAAAAKGESRVDASVQAAGAPFASEPADVSGPGSIEGGPAAAFDDARVATVAYAAPVEGKNAVFASSRPITGGFGVPGQLSEAGAAADAVAAAQLAGGGAIVAWRQPGEPAVIDASTRSGASPFSAPLQVIHGTSALELSQVVSDGLGDAAALWTTEAAGRTPEVAGYDAAGPALGGLAIPSTGTAGQALSFSVSPFDVWSGLGATQWDFGDGTTALGTNVAHTYAAAGRYTVTVRASDVLGNSSVSSGSVAVAPAAAPVSVAAPPSPAPPPAAPVPNNAPRLTGVSQSHREWRAGSALATISSRRRRAPVGTTFRLTVDQQAKLTLAFTRSATGRRVGGRCVPLTAKNRRAPACALSRAAGTIALPGLRGLNSIVFAGRVSTSKRLEPGRYTVAISAKNPAGERSATSTLAFTIVR